MTTPSGSKFWVIWGLVAKLSGRWTMFQSGVLALEGEMLECVASSVMLDFRHWRNHKR